ncbi:hypothetical protein H310_09794 [Aphanomyces invadans]|uniref:Uncharacterized protein n=1 Tax=Aphanomyces invadans TaxID=157072 RepID=A0A024TUE9_9STRA|nr:hypothetical protein H310_09794 [Aphanomyces invadans]ETV96932.1 hypothetical protein H310_09794 [Aphanomyces invadans]|eukprot:XP_008874178.1 hypothetical protein H310_09794 [Aphanomyces invadans]
MTLKKGGRSRDDISTTAATVGRSIQVFYRRGRRAKDNDATADRDVPSSAAARRCRYRYVPTTIDNLGRSREAAAIFTNSDAQATSSGTAAAPIAAIVVLYVVSVAPIAAMVPSRTLRP